jgi:hypothetical protein
MGIEMREEKPVRRTRLEIFQDKLARAEAALARNLGTPTEARHREHVDYCRRLVAREEKS